MATAADKARRKKTGQDWSTSGSFINKPAKGWLHPDEQLKPDAGICYGVRYVGCMEVKQSMKSLDFETRTAVAKESISRVCEAAGLKTSPKKVKKSKVTKLLGEQPNMLFAGDNVNLTITTESITIMVMESGEIIASHQMPGISFASGGDPDTMDFVAYVAKDEMFGRSCHVLECGGGLAQDVITTIGQAFEIRFKQYLAKRPNAVSIPDRLETGPPNSDAWGDEPEDRDYYNDRPGAIPPEIPSYASTPNNIPVSDGVYNSVKEREKERVSHYVLEDNMVYDNGMGDANVYDNGEEQANVYDNSEKDTMNGLVYDNKTAEAPRIQTNGDVLHPDLAVYDNKAERPEIQIAHPVPVSEIPPPLQPARPPPSQPSPPARPTPSQPSPPIRSASSQPSPPMRPTPQPTVQPLSPPTRPTSSQPSPPIRPVQPSVLVSQGSIVSQMSSEGLTEPAAINGNLDSFDMTPFCSSLPHGAEPPTAESLPSQSPYGELWFHGKITRQQVEELLQHDGDFLVRESTHSVGQFVLSGRHQGRIKHLLLIDPEGIVRTKDRTFDSIAHLIQYHMTEKLPITSSDSEILLRNPIASQSRN